MINSYQKKYKFQQIQKQDFNFQLLDESRVFLTGPYQAFTEEVKIIIKQNSGYFQNLDGEKGWTVPINQYLNLISNLRQLNSEIIIKQIPTLLQRLQNLNMKEIKYLDNGQFVTLNYEKQIAYQLLDQELDKSLYQYQRDCIKQGIKFNGRILIADEMGVGKTVQSLALVSLYQYAWPLLIVCPSALRLNWQDEILTWLKIGKTDIQLINSGKECIRMNAKIVIVSYDICAKIKENLIARKFQICIADECHYLKSPNSIRSQVCVPILRQCLHVILLTGTPALSKPRDLFNQINMIRPDIFSNFKEFGYRYCDPKLSRFTKGMDFDGASNLKELHFLLTNYIMIRRLKKDVLSQLPEKRRIKVRIPGEIGYVKQIGALLKKLGNIDIQQLMNKEMTFSEKFDNMNENIVNVNSILMKCYQLTGQAKIKGIKDYISTLLENEIKFLFFAHHLEILDAVEEFCLQNEVLFIRIDGNVSNEQRHENVKRFQQDDVIRVAILSVTSANFGITLTASSTIIFGEMHWTPAIMMQAEDRAHRIGQQECVDCHYLIGDGTLDDHIFQKIECKMKTVSNFIDGQKQNMGAIEFQQKDIIINQKLSKKTIQEQQTQQQNIETPQSPKTPQSPQSIKSLNEEDLEEIFQFLDSQENKKSENLQQNQLKQNPIELSSQVKQSSNQLKQQLMDKYLKSNQVKKEVIEDQKVYNQIQNVVQQKKTLDYGQLPQKLGIDYLKNRLGDDSKQTESGKKRLPIVLTSSGQKSIIKINPSTQQSIN